MPKMKAEPSGLHYMAEPCGEKASLSDFKRTLQNRAFVQILPESFREVLKSLTPKAFGIDQNPWFCKALW